MDRFICNAYMNCNRQVGVKLNKFTSGPHITVAGFKLQCRLIDDHTSSSLRIHPSVQAR